MVLKVDSATITVALVEALRKAITIDERGKPRTGVVRISDFKKTNVNSFAKEEFNIRPIVLANAHLWENLRGQVPDAVLIETDDAVTAVIEDLQLQGIVKRGGEVSSHGQKTTYPEDDWLTLTSKGLQKLIAGESGVSAQTDDSQHFDQREFHPELVKSSRDLFRDGHYPQAIFEACKMVCSQVRAKSGATGDGSSLMTSVFSVAKPILRFNDQANQSEKDEQLGFMLLFQGTMLGIRNPAGHEMQTLKDRTRALEYLSFLSLLLRRLDETKK